MPVLAEPAAAAAQLADRPVSGHGLVELAVERLQLGAGCELGQLGQVGTIGLRLSDHGRTIPIDSTISSAV